MNNSVLKQGGKCGGRLLVLLFALAGLSGCASVGLDAQAVDQPLPDMKRQSLCHDVPGHRLPVGQSCSFIVQPAVRYDERGNGTELVVRSGENYEIILDGDQYWYDLDRRVPVGTGDSGAGITKLFGFMKHHTEYKWFALMATVRFAPDDATALDQSAVKPKYISKEDPMFSVSTKGELVFYVNDAALFYDNNSGRALVEIKRHPDGTSLESPH